MLDECWIQSGAQIHRCLQCEAYLYSIVEYTWLGDFKIELVLDIVDTINVKINYD